MRAKPPEPETRRKPAGTRHDEGYKSRKHRAESTREREVRNLARFSDFMLNLISSCLKSFVP